MATKPISLRIPEEVKRELETIARRFGTTSSTLAADYLVQGIRAFRHPSIEFRQTPAGRMAYVRGVRLPVWMAVKTIEECDGDAAEAAQLLGVSELLMKAALAYGNAFSEEIAGDREAGSQAPHDLETLVPNHSFIRV